MEHVSIEAVEASGEMGGQVKRALAEPLGAEGCGLDFYTVEPGGAVTGGLHATVGQEAVYYVTDGTATVETLSEPGADTETTTVAAGEVCRIAAGEYRQARNEADEPLSVLVISVPADPEEFRVPQPCEACGESDYLVTEFTASGIELVCPACSTSFEL